jgi:hypothetical protein
MHVSGTKSTATAFLTVLTCLSTACTTMRPITADASGEQVRLELKPGDTVHVLTKDGASHSFEVTAIGATSVVGKAVRIVGVSSPDPWGARIDLPYAEVAQIEVRRTEGLKTVVIVAAAAAVAAVAIAAAGQKSPPRTSY